MTRVLFDFFDDDDYYYYLLLPSVLSGVTRAQPTVLVLIIIIIICYHSLLYSQVLPGHSLQCWAWATVRCGAVVAVAAPSLHPERCCGCTQAVGGSCRLAACCSATCAACFSMQTVSEWTTCL